MPDSRLRKKCHYCSGPAVLNSLCKECYAEGRPRTARTFDETLSKDDLQDDGRPRTAKLLDVGAQHDAAYNGGTFHSGEW
jgi:hypothetical protein